MKRILLINSEYPPMGGGAGNASAHLAAELVNLGQEVTVLTAHFDHLPQDSVERGVRILRIKAMRRKQDRSGALEQGIFLVAGSLGVLSLVRQWHPDVILAFFGIPGGAVAWATKFFTGIPYLVSLRGGDVPGFRPYDFAIYHRMVAPLLHRVWRGAGAVVANSLGLGALAGSFDQRVEFLVIPNGVDIHRFSLPSDRTWETTRMLFVGRLVYQKGVDLLIRALGSLKDIPWSLNLVGDGPRRADLENQSEALGIRQRINFKGWLNKEALLGEYNQANLFVFPSRHEGMSNAVLEAMACGLPVIASNISGNEELVVSGETGLLVPPEDPRALNGALRVLLADFHRRMEMGKASRIRVETGYTWDRTARQYLALLQELKG